MCFVEGRTDEKSRFEVEARPSALVVTRERLGSCLGRQHVLFSSLTAVNETVPP